MPLAARHQITQTLLGKSPDIPASAQLSNQLDNLTVTVDGVGTLSHKVTTKQANAIRELCAPAPFGKGEETIIDSTVRDTWLVPKERVRIDFGGDLDTVVAEATEALGMPSQGTYRAEFHSMLLYAEGHFFAPHQDSATTDDMVATLTIVLPTPHVGGALVVHDKTGPVRYAGSRTANTVLAWYADARHEVERVSRGRRIVLTFNLLREPDDTQAPAEASPDVALSRLITKHFDEPSAWDFNDVGKTKQHLLYLLDREYTPRGLHWDRLKAPDEDRVARLKHAADLADCETALVLVEVKETSSYFEGDSYYDCPPDEELIDQEYCLTHQLRAGQTQTHEVDHSIHDDVVCAAVATESLTPVHEEHEGYMGNYGNTMDRWYRRAGLLIYPKTLSLINQIDTEPAAALSSVLAQLNDADDNTKILASLQGAMPSWQHAAGRIRPNEETATTVFDLAMTVDNSQMAQDLLKPLSALWLTPETSPHFAQLCIKYQQAWTTNVVESLAATLCRQAYPHWGAAASTGERTTAWFDQLPQLYVALAEHADLAALLTTHLWAPLQLAWGRRAQSQTPATAPAQVGDLATRTAQLWQAAIIADVTDVADAIYKTCAAAPADASYEVARDAGSWPDEIKAASTADVLAAKVVEDLREIAQRPHRDPDDWSIPAPPVYNADQLRIFFDFLESPRRRELTWALAKEGRREIHQLIDSAQLPISHVTERTGSPYKLVLKKTRALFTREEETRNVAEARATSLTALWPKTRT